MVEAGPLRSKGLVGNRVSRIVATCSPGQVAERQPELHAGARGGGRRQLPCASRVAHQEDVHLPSSRGHHHVPHHLAPQHHTDTCYHVVALGARFACGRRFQTHSRELLRRPRRSGSCLAAAERSADGVARVCRTDDLPMYGWAWSKAQGSSAANMASANGLQPSPTAVPIAAC